MNFFFQSSENIISKSHCFVKRKTINIFFLVFLSSFAILANEDQKKSPPLLEKKSTKKKSQEFFLKKNEKSSTTESTKEQPLEPKKNSGILKDPFEKYNRSVFAFNQWMDFGPLGPFYVMYNKCPYGVKSILRQFLTHCQFPVFFINSLFQGRPRAALRHLQRFVINTVFGAGLFDISKSVFKIYEKPTGFAQTLLRWGFVQDRYVMLSFFGPCSIIHGLGMTVDCIFQPLSYFLYPGFAYYFLYVVDNKVPLEKLLRSYSHSKDPYNSLREFYGDLALRI